MDDINTVLGIGSHREFSNPCSTSTNVNNEDFLVFSAIFLGFRYQYSAEIGQFLSSLFNEFLIFYHVAY